MENRSHSDSGTPRPLDADLAIKLWAEAYDASEAMLLAGLRRQIGPNGDLKAAYRQWYEQYRAEHDRARRTMLERLAEAERKHGQ
jgi:hypothetical protein